MITVRLCSLIVNSQLGNYSAGSTSAPLSTISSSVSYPHFRGRYFSKKLGIPFRIASWLLGIKNVESLSGFQHASSAHAHCDLYWYWYWYCRLHVPQTVCECVPSLSVWVCVCVWGGGISVAVCVCVTGDDFVDAIAACYRKSKLISDYKDDCRCADFVCDESLANKTPP